MSSLSNLQLAVEQEVQRRHNEIVLGVFQWMCKKHNKLGICSCEYCQKLPEYVAAKRYLQRLKNSDYHLYPNEFINNEDIDQSIAYARWRVKHLKVEKDTLKLIQY